MQLINEQPSLVDYNARAPRATRPRRPAKVEVRAAPPSDSVTSCASESESESPVGEAVDPRVEDEVVMLAVLLPEWLVAEEAMAAVEEVMLMESVLVMLMDSVSLAVLELSVVLEAAEEDSMEDELALGAALLSLSMTKGGV